VRFFIELDARMQRDIVLDAVNDHVFSVLFGDFWLISN
jgi:hypothetical protein